MADKGKTGVLLLNLGGPDSLEAVRPFLKNLFSDRGIIKLSRFGFMQRSIASRIAASRAKKVIPRYEQIGGRSPILPLTELQARGIEGELTRKGYEGIKAYIGMRYWNPYIADTVAEMARDGITKIVALPLYPQFSKATTGSCFEQVKKAAAENGCSEGDIDYIGAWYADPGYTEALAEMIKEELARFEGPESEVHVLFSAHSLPQEFIDSGDPYCDHMEATIGSVRDHFANDGGLPEYTLAFQSRSGPVKWLEPGTDDAIKSLAEEGWKRLLVVPISFVSDHIETLYELDLEYRELAESVGIQEYRRVPAFNGDQRFASALADIVSSHVTHDAEEPT